MARKRVLRPRTLGLIFGGYVVLIAIIAWYFATGAGSNYVYGPDMTRWAYTAYLVSAAALLSTYGGFLAAYGGFLAALRRRR